MTTKPDRLEFVMEEIKNLLKIHTPLELVFFPSAGYTTALNRIIIESSMDKGKDIFIDIDINFIENFTTDIHPYFDMLVKKSIISAFDKFNIEINTESDLTMVIQQIFKWAMKNSKTLIFVFKNIGLNSFYKEHFFKDLILKLDSFRIISPANLNYITANFYPVYLKNYKNGVLPILPKFFHLQTFPNEARDTIKLSFKDFEYKDFTNANVEYFYEITGGVIGLVKSLLRDLRLQNLKLDSLNDYSFDNNFFELFENTTIRIEQILSFYPSEYIVLLSKVLQNKKLDEKEKDIYSFFEKIGFISNNKIFCKLIEESIKIKGLAEPEIINTISKREVNTNNENFKNITENISLDIFTYEILRNSNRTGVFLTNTEFNILNQIFNKSEKLVSRDDIARIIWGKDYLDKYSDWAIDKTISRIREKLEDNKPYKIITTLKGRGFILMQ